MDIRRIQQVLKYGKQHAKEIAALDSVNKGWFSIFIDILCCYYKYGMWSNQYKKEKFWRLTSEQRNEIGIQYKEENDYRDSWVKEYFKSLKFINKWSRFKFETSASSQQKRIDAYINKFNMGKGSFIGFGVIISKHHYSNERLIVGEKCEISRNVEIDYTGGLTIGNGVEITEGAKILTHNHDFFGMISEEELLKNTARAYKTPLVIEDNVFIGTRALVMPGVNRIGENAIISAGSVVTQEVKPNTIVAGNPAKLVGKLPRVYFRYKQN